MRHARSAILLSILVAAPVVSSSAQRPDFSLTPFASFIRTPDAGRAAGLALMYSRDPDFAFRASGRMALRNTYEGAPATGSFLPPWNADADLVMRLGGQPFGPINRGPGTFVFLGIGSAATDSGVTRVTARNWSYGIGTMLPFGSKVDLFADSRWRMREFVLPTAKPKPVRTTEYRIGLTFHIGGTTNSRGRVRRQ